MISTPASAAFHYSTLAAAASTKMVLTLRWEACVAQFRAEGRPILWAAAPYSAKRWQEALVIVRRAALESEASADSESEASADNPWTSMSERAAATEYDLSSGDEGSPPGITSVVLPYDDFDGIDWPHGTALWGDPGQLWLHGRPVVPGIMNQLEPHFMLVAAAGGYDEQRRLLARRQVMMFLCEGFFVRYLLASWRQMCLGRDGDIFF